ncbi:MAG: SUMF1/EgtB/PvdO family nonheme iron enzyme [Verrucomicrobiota bacterium]
MSCAVKQANDIGPYTGGGIRFLIGDSRHIDITLQLEAILKIEKREHLLKNFLDEGVDDAVLGYLTDSDLKDLGVARIGDRRRLLAAFAKLNNDSPNRQVTAMPTASISEPYVNSIGLPFVPIPRFKTLVCIWPIRVRDYRLYCAEKGIEFPDQKNPTDSEHPVVNVNWHDGIDFCLWLTAREREAGQMPDDQFYRLLTDLEWSAAVGLPNEIEETPAERSKQKPGYPWGPVYPPRKGVGNYHPSLKVDDWDFTSPVGSFKPNEHGIYDLSGNVWEWCMDNYNTSRTYHTLRGGAWDFYGSGLMSSARNANDPNGKGASVGFRIAWAPQEHFTNQPKGFRT